MNNLFTDRYYNIYPFCQQSGFLRWLAHTDEPEREDEAAERSAETKVKSYLFQQTCCYPIKAVQYKLPFDAM